MGEGVVDQCANVAHGVHSMPKMFSMVDQRVSATPDEILNVNVSWHFKARDSSNNFLHGPICNAGLFQPTDSGLFSRSDTSSEVGRGVSLEGTGDTWEQFVLSLIYAWGGLIAAESWIYFTSIIGVSLQESNDLHIE